MKKLISIVLISVLLLSLTACGAGGGAGNAAPAAAPELYATDSGGYGYAPETPAAAPMEFEDDWWDGDPQFEMPPLGGGSSITDGRKITFSASISLNTKQFDADYVKIYQLIDMSGGYISSERTTDDSSYYGKPVGRTSYFSIRVPASDYNNFIDAVSTIGEVTSKNKWSEDLTSQYFDTEARIEMLQLRKERLMAYLLEAEKAEDIVAFERELSDVLYDLDFYQGNKRSLDRLVDYATIDISLYELITPETIGKDGEPLGDRASSAFLLSLDNVLRGLDAFVVGFAAAVPVLILLIIIGAIIWVIFRLTRPLRKKLKARREEREKNKKPPVQQMPYWQQPGYQQQPVYQQPAPPPPPPAPKRGLDAVDETPAEPPKKTKDK